MIQRIKHIIFRHKLKKRLIKFVNNKETSSKEIIAVGVLTTDEISSKFNLKAEIEKQLPVRNTKVMSFRNFSKYDEPSFRHFTERDIDFNGEFTQENLQSFLQQPFDLLIGYFESKNEFLEMAVLQSNATFRVGFSNVNPDLYDMEILSESTNVTLFSKELYKYLKILKKIKN